MICNFRDTCKKYVVDKSVDGESCISMCLKYTKTKSLLDNALLTDAQQAPIPLCPQEIDLEAFNELKDWTVNVVSNVEAGKSLYIHSNHCGNGKTSWAIKILVAFVNKIWYNSDMTCRVLFVHVPKYLSAIKSNLSTKNHYAEHINKYIATADLVVWDDIATKALTTFEAETLLSIIDDRINAKKSNIYTCNLTPEEMLDKLEARLYSRIVNMSKEVILRGDDRRGESLT